ncbi:MAG: VOC family protein [Actinomycetota bacterium]
MSTTPAPIGWFEIAASDTEKAEAFYGGIFGWSFQSDPNVPSYRIHDAGETGVSGGITTAVAGVPDTYAIFSVMVPDVAAACGRVAELGGRVLVGPETVEGNGLVFANLEDPDGNHFGVFTPPIG